MLIIGFGIIFLALMIGCIVGLKKSDSYSNEGWWIGTVFSGLILIIIIIVALVAYAANATRVSELKAFRDVNVQNYSVVVAETRAILSSEEFIDKMVEGSLEKTGTGQSIADRIKEWRDAVNQYNIEVAGKQRTRSLWLYPGWLIMPPEINELALLTIK